MLFVAAHHALLFISQQYVTSAVASLIMSLDPVLAAVFSGPLLADERISLSEAVGIGCGVFGTALIAAPTGGALVHSDLRGVMLVFLSTGAFALGAVLTKRYRSEIPVQSMQAWMMLIGGAFLHVTIATLPGESIESAS